MKYVAIILLSLSMLLFTAGCLGPQKTDLDGITDPKPHVDNAKTETSGAKKKLADVNTGLKASNDGIKKETKNIESKITELEVDVNGLDREVARLNADIQDNKLENAPETITKMKGHISGIRDSITEIAKRTDEISEYTVRLEAIVDQLGRVETNLDKAEAGVQFQKEENAKLTKEVENLKQELSESTEKQRQTLFWIFVIPGALGTLMIIAGVIFAIFSKGSFLMEGIGLAISGFLLIGVSVALIQWGTQFAIGALIVFGIVAAFWVWQTWDQMRKKRKAEELAEKEKALTDEVAMREKVLEEVVETVEIAKQELPEDKKLEIFGYKAKPGAIVMVQSPETKKEVMRVRSNGLKKKMEHTIVHTPKKE